MANIKITALPLGTPKGTDVIPGVDTLVGVDGITKKYLRSDELKYFLTAQGLTAYSAASVATTGALTVTYANGTLGVGATLTNAGAQVALTIDGVLMTVAARVLVKNQASTFQNGIYTVTTVGTGATNWVLTRATDYDQAAEVIQYGVAPVSQGTINAGLVYQETGAGPFTIGTTPITFTAYSVAVPTGAVLLAPSAAQTINTFGLTVPSLTTANLSFDVTANSILSTGTNGNINVVPNGSGVIALGNANVNPGFGKVQINAVSNLAVASLNCWGGASANNSGQFYFVKSRSATPGVFTAVVANDVLAKIQFYGDDGTKFSASSQILVQTTGIISSGVVPGSFIIQTANSSGTLTSAITIDSAQVLTLANPLAAGSGGTGVSSLGTGVATALGQNVTGSGAIVLANAPTFVTGTVTAPSITFNTTSGVIGTTTNNSAAAGSVGEFVSSVVLVGGAVSATNITAFNVTSISLTAGDWDVWGNICYKGGATTNVRLLVGWISSTSATQPSDDNSSNVNYGVAGFVPFTTADLLFTVPGKRFSLSGTTTVYLSGIALFNTSTLSGYGAIYARRRR